MQRNHCEFYLFLYKSQKLCSIKEIYVTTLLRKPKIKNILNKTWWFLKLEGFYNHLRAVPFNHTWYSRKALSKWGMVWNLKIALTFSLYLTPTHIWNFNVPSLRTMYNFRNSHKIDLYFHILKWILMLLLF